jgi:hypothetical protein
MAPRAERKPSSQEVSLAPSERRELNILISNSLVGDRLGIIMDARLESYSPYILLKRLMELRQETDLSPAQKAQLIKMTILGVKQMPAELPPGVKSLDEFMVFLAEEAPEEVVAASRFKPDLKDLPRPWKMALADWRNAEKQLLGKK